ncbi:flagellar hook-basal body complex protein FliE [Pinirhizobacter sp.]|jgi:flagellar hook-basal body complex protein FliE|uniref:flagellar hook-basal body complex protein FliE n=1 Tax=Pinirhizobacter sp. TaxID=2950432 RepID=UPI002F3FC0FA
MIEPIAPLSSLGSLASLDAAPGAMHPIDTGHGFADAVGKSLVATNDSLNAADDAARVLAAGGDMPVHEVMIAMEKARLDLQFAVQVRNRVVAAYHDVVNMQV